MSEGSTQAVPRSVAKTTDRGTVVDDYFAVLRPVLEGISETFGRNCEVVLHDFRRPENSIVMIAGDVTRRRVGGSVSQIGLSIMAAGEDAEDQYNYITRAPNGRVLKSTTTVLRDPDGHVFGALCINVDVTDLRLLTGVLEELAGSSLQPPEPITFVDEVGQVVSEMINEEEIALSRPLDRLTKQDRLNILRALDRRGIFTLQRSVPQVAEHLGISRATVYTDLHEIRGADADGSKYHEDGAKP